MRDTFLTKLRGFFGLGAIGAGIGAVLGGAGYALAGLLAGSVLPFSIVNAAIVYGSFGFFTTAGLGLFLANARSKASLDEVSVVWSGLIGVVAGAAFPVLFNALMMQSLRPIRLIVQMFPIMGTLGLFGGALTAGMVALAKSGNRALGPGGEERLIDG